MNLSEKYDAQAAGLSIGQYCPPRCFELAGKEFRFIMDTGEEAGDIVLKFLDETKVQFSVQNGKRAGEADYECRKGDDWTYLVTYCLQDPRENHTFVIDKEQGLVTFLRCPLGENPYYPYLIESHWTFGYIFEEDKEHTDRKRHGFTDDVSGTSVKWTYGHKLATVHVYYNSKWYRITYPRDKSKPEEPVSTENLNNAVTNLLPGPDEPAFYVQIKEGMYFVSVTEQNMEKILGEKMGFRSDTLCFLDNWNRMYSVGRGYGTATHEGKDSEIFVMIGKYGTPEEVDEHFFTDPCPYLV